MNSIDIDTATYLARLRALASQYRSDFDIEVVPSIKIWCEENRVPEDNPFRSGKALLNNKTGRYLILLANPITASMISSAVSAMLFRQRVSESEAESMMKPEVFLTHILLHEIAHTLDDKWSEDKCDRWAFDQMRRSSL